MSVAAVVEAVLGGLGCALVVLPTLAMLLVPRLEDRLHLLAPSGTLGLPLVALALIVANGFSLASGEIALTALIVVVSGPAVTAAVARVGHERAQHRAEEPE